MVHVMRKKSLRLGISFVAVAALFASFETTGSTASSSERVRFHWDWATQPMQSRGAANAKPETRPRLGLPEDFSHRSVFFPEVIPAKRAAAVQRDSRFWQQYLRRHARRVVPFDPTVVPDPNASAEVVRDWNYSLNNGSAGTIGAPAKYSFNINAVPSCTNDFIVTGVNIAGA